MQIKKIGTNFKPRSFQIVGIKCLILVRVNYLCAFERFFQCYNLYDKKNVFTIKLFNPFNQLQIMIIHVFTLLLF